MDAKAETNSTTDAGAGTDTAGAAAPGPTAQAPEPAHAARELRVLVGRLRRRLREVDDVHELTASQLAVLGRLDRDGPASTSDLAKAEHVRPQSMAATIAALDERGMIARRQDPADGRRQLLELTPAADDAVRGSRQARDEWLECALRERFSAEELATVVAALGFLERLSE
ncbi:MarR family winged helix-turn-helix transcriptional regulator [Catenulispora pinistramenti]|uniref:MarR family winged helix-turn-helix transcriptional regulator n=1 Tax=Catenulispora pinistramenti TaxID=2705254 RepID=UPI001E2B2A8C|nr:MarR family transcriptional regulator [Catenulispora pinistramenti]